MSRRMLALAWLAMVLAGCGHVDVSAVDAEPSVQTWLEGATGAGGVLVVQVEVPLEAAFDLDDPTVQGLSLQPGGAARVETIGEQRVITRRYSYSGPPGIYEVPAVEVSWTGSESEGSVRSVPLWIDLEVAPPRQGELVDISEPEPTWTLPWGVILVGGGLVLLVAGGAVFAFRAAPGADVDEEELEPPDVRALQAWEAAWRDPALDDQAKALAISSIFRVYTEEVLAFPATAWTTPEILQRFDDLVHLPKDNLPRAKRLLRATDRVKFADEDATEALFVELDSDLRGFLTSTAPRLWDGGRQS